MDLTNARGSFLFCIITYVAKGLPWWLSSKENTSNAGEAGLIPGSGRSPGKRNGYPLQYSCLENPMDRSSSPRGHKELKVTEHARVCSQELEFEFCHSSGKEENGC